LTVRRFVRQHGIAYATFMSWRGSERKSRATPQHGITYTQSDERRKPVQFAELALPDTPLGLAKGKRLGKPQHSRASFKNAGTIEVRFPDGVVVRSGGDEVDGLLRIVQALREAR